MEPLLKIGSNSFFQGNANWPDLEQKDKEEHWDVNEQLRSNPVFLDA